MLGIALDGNADDGLNNDDMLATVELTADDTLEIKELTKEARLDAKLPVEELLAVTLEERVEATTEEKRLDTTKDDDDGMAEALENPDENSELEISKLDDSMEDAVEEVTGDEVTEEKALDGLDTNTDDDEAPTDGDATADDSTDEAALERSKEELGLAIFPERNEDKEETTPMKTGKTPLATAEELEKKKTLMLRRARIEVAVGGTRPSDERLAAGRVAL